MKPLIEYINQAQADHVALGHFNISNLEALWAIFNAAKALDLPVIIGISEGERDFIGLNHAVALVRSFRDTYSYPIFLNADHSYSLETARAAIDAGVDSVILDAAKMPFEDNVKLTKQVVDYAKSKNPSILVEGELGYIGSSSALLDEIPQGATVGVDQMTSPQQAKDYVAQTGVDLLAPAVGNLHGMLKHSKNPHLNIDLISQIKQAVNIPLVLHGGSGIPDEDFTKAIAAGFSIVHINSEIRLAYREALKKSLADQPDQIAPYKLLKPVVTAVQQVVSDRLKLFSQSST